MVSITFGRFVYFGLDSLVRFLFVFGSDYSEVPASKPDREGFLGFVGATCAGATTSSAGGLVDLFIALSAE